MFSKNYPLVLTIFVYFSNIGPSFGSNFEKSTECQVTQSIDPVAIAMSPGFLSGALPYIGNHACTEAGTCQNIPFSCPTSSCCTPNTSYPVPTALAHSECGCWDSKRKTCKPFRSFRIGLDVCDPKTGNNVKSDFELSSANNLDGICKDSRVSVEFGADVQTKSFKIRVSSKLCLQKIKIQLGPDDLRFRTKWNPNEVLIDVEGYVLLKEEQLLNRKLSRPEIEHVLNILSNPDQKNYGQNERLDCQNYSGTTAISMSPNFFSGSLNTYLSQQSQVCGVYGECNPSNPACETTGCCMLSSSSNVTGCDCIENSGNCLLEHKVFKWEGQACTTNGENVKTNLVVNMPSKDFDECTESNSGQSSVKYALNDVGNVEVTLEIKQCIKTSVAEKYLEVETIVVAEVNVDQFMGVLRQLVLV